MAEDELIDVLDASGAAVGVKTRAQVHAAGDWHGLVFVWSAWVAQGRRWMMLQRRARAGDPFAGQVDALAGGHIGAGESPAASAGRELREEVGLRIEPADLIELGTMRMDRAGNACRRVIEHLLLYPHPLDLECMTFSDEVDGVLLVDFDGFTDLVHRRRSHLKAHLRQGVEAPRIDALSPAAIAAYPDSILATFRHSLAVIDHYLHHGEVEPQLIGIWPRSRHR